jgi:hypothetical protein
MPSLDIDPVAADVAGTLTNGLPADDVVTFVGYVGPGAAKDTFRLYTDPWFGEWLELTEDDVVHQLKGSDETGGRSHVWVKSYARVIRSQAATAGEFAATVDHDDPAATRYPRR